MKGIGERVKVQCMECGRKFQTMRWAPKCPACGSYDIDLDEIGFIPIHSEASRRKVVQS